MIAPEPKLIRRANGATIAAPMAIATHATSNDFRLNCSFTRIVLSTRSGVSAVKLCIRNRSVEGRLAGQVLVERLAWTACFSQNTD